MKAAQEAPPTQRCRLSPAAAGSGSRSQMLPCSVKPYWRSSWSLVQLAP